MITVAAFDRDDGRWAPNGGWLRIHAIVLRVGLSIVDVWGGRGRCRGGLGLVVDTLDKSMAASYAAGVAVLAWSLLRRLVGWPTI